MEITFTKEQLNNLLVFMNRIENIRAVEVPAFVDLINIISKELNVENKE